MGDFLPLLALLGEQILVVEAERIEDRAGGAPGVAVDECLPIPIRHVEGRVAILVGGTLRHHLSGIEALDLLALPLQGGDYPLEGADIGRLHLYLLGTESTTHDPSDHQPRDRLFAPRYSRIGPGRRAFAFTDFAISDRNLAWADFSGSALFPGLSGIFPSAQGVWLGLRTPSPRLPDVDRVLAEKWAGPHPVFTHWTSTGVTPSDAPPTIIAHRPVPASAPPSGRGRLGPGRACRNAPPGGRR